MTTSKPTRAALYARVSTADQTTTNQILELRRYAEARGWTTAEYLDLTLTMSPLAVLTKEQVTEVLDCLGTSIEAAGGSFTMNYNTLAVAVTRA